MKRALQAINRRLFYHDFFSVRRVKSELKSNGSRRQVYQAVADMQDLPCAFSANSHASSYPNRTLEKHDYGYQKTILKRIFCDVALDIQAGDLIEVVTKNGYQQEFIAGEPMLYQSHQEVLLQFTGEV